MVWFAIELTLTVALAYVATEMVKPKAQRWTLAQSAKHLAFECYSSGQGLVCAVCGLTAVGMLLYTVLLAGTPSQLDAEEREELDEAKSDALRALLCMAAFTALAYADLRSRCVGTRLSWLWFIRAACAACLKTICYIAPVVALVSFVPLLLLCKGLESLGLAVTARWILAVPARYLLQHGPYVSVYYVIKRDFATSRAAQLPLLPTSTPERKADGDADDPAGDGDESRLHASPGGLMGWLSFLRREMALDATLRRADRAAGRAHHGCSTPVLCAAALATCCLVGLFLVVLAPVVLGDVVARDASYVILPSAIDAQHGQPALVVTQHALPDGRSEIVVMEADAGEVVVAAESAALPERVHAF